VVELAKLQFILKQINMNNAELQKLIKNNSRKPLKILKGLGGYYQCPKDPSGKRLGPLVGYTGKYESAGLKKQYVGDVYVNFSIAEQYPAVINKFAKSLVKKIPYSFRAVSIDVICAPQMGGIAFGQLVALQMQKRFAYIEKETTQFATDTLREQSKLSFLRHSISPGDKVLITEDVLNNFSTTKECIELVEACGATVTCIASMLNRSSTTSYYVWKDRKIPLYSLVELTISQWPQEDDSVKNDIAAGNIALKPKNEWSKLAAAMYEADRN
jgi:adenine/guanine phosphoribosyltransferase-like PRPP-binding protein